MDSLLQGLNLCLLFYRQILYHLSHQGRPQTYYLEVLSQLLDLLGPQFLSWHNWNKNNSNFLLRLFFKTRLVHTPKILTRLLDPINIQ